MKSFAVGEVWLAKFPFEEDPSKFKMRPVVVLDKDNVVGILSVKVTTHEPRKSDPYDTDIVYWDEAGLRVASTARVSKTMRLDESRFKFQLGNLRLEDLQEIQKQYIKYISSL